MAAASSRSHPTFPSHPILDERTVTTGSSRRPRYVYCNLQTTLTLAGFIFFHTFSLSLLDNLRLLAISRRSIEKTWSALSKTQLSKPRLQDCVVQLNSFHDWQYIARLQTGHLRVWESRNSAPMHGTHPRPVSSLWRKLSGVPAYPPSASCPRSARRHDVAPEL